jgi:Fe-S oxidoreductase
VGAEVEDLAYHDAIRREKGFVMIDPRTAVQEFAESCIRCGLCTTASCGNYGNDEPNLGEICESLLKGEETWEYFPFTCALCNHCTIKCPAHLHAADATKPLRALGLQKHPELKANYRKFRTDLKYNLFSALKARNEGDITAIIHSCGVPDLGGDADHTAFFPGCALFAYSPGLTSKISMWLHDQGIAAYTLFICCGASFYDVGFFDEYEAYRKRALAYIQERKIEHLIVSCPHCNHLLPELLEGSGIDIKLLPDVLVEQGKTSATTQAVSFHDACYDRDTGAFGTAARSLFENAELKSMKHEKRDCLCCGGGGMVSMYAPDYCTYRRNQRLAEIDASGADRVLSTCFSCVNSLQRGTGSVPVQHYLEQLFDYSVDWNEVYAGVDGLFADPAYEELCSGEEFALE